MAAEFAVHRLTKGLLSLVLLIALLTQVGLVLTGYMEGIVFVGYGCRSFFGSSETESVGSKTDKSREEDIETHVYRHCICCTHWDSHASACKLLEDRHSTLLLS